MFEPYYIVPVLFWLSVLLFNYKEIRLAKTLDPMVNRKYIYWAQIVLFIGIIIRTIYLNIPVGIFPDEAISGYDSWCLANYGVDQHLSSYPVYLKSWGTGQSAMYAYLGAPFVKLFGLSLPLYRLPMALASSLSLIMLYYTLRKTQKSSFYILLITLFMAVSPWHIIKSRWALDCNLAPDFLLIAACLFILGYYYHNQTSKKSLFYYIGGCIFLALTAYSYGVSWFLLPVFCILLFVFLYRKEKITIFQMATCLITLAVLLLPLMLFALQMVTRGDQYQLGPITITALADGRHNATTIIGSEAPLEAFTMYMQKGVHMLIFGDDGLRWNTFYLFGQFYNIVSIPFILIAFYILRKKEQRNLFDAVFAIWLIAALPTILLVEPNVNHWNILWFPLIYFTAKGIYFCVKDKVWSRHLSLAMLVILFAAFSRKYVSFFNKEDDTFTSGYWAGYTEYLSFFKDKEFDTIYFSERYPLILFYELPSPYLFDRTKRTNPQGYPFDMVSGYSNYNFYIPDTIVALPSTAYLIRNDKLDYNSIDTTKFSLKRNRAYTLLWRD